MQITVAIHTKKTLFFHIHFSLKKTLRQNGCLEKYKECTVDSVAILKTKYVQHYPYVQIL